MTTDEPRDTAEEDATVAEATLILSGSTTYAIGDIHGCYDLMVDLLDRIVADIRRSHAGRGTMLVFLGDYIDRGPASSDVIDALLWIDRHSPLPAVFLRGNNEQTMLDYLQDPVGHQQWLRFGGSETLRSYGLIVPKEIASAAEHRELRDRFVERLPSAHLDFLRGLRLFHETARHIFVHAGIKSGIPLRRQEAEDLLWIREGFLEEQRPGKKRVVHGHTWTGERAQVLAHRIGVDTGAYETGVLTAVRLDGELVDFISTAD